MGHFTLARFYNLSLKKQSFCLWLVVIAAILLIDPVRYVMETATTSSFPSTTSIWDTSIQKGISFCSSNYFLDMLMLWMLLSPHVHIMLTTTVKLCICVHSLCTVTHDLWKCSWTLLQTWHSVWLHTVFDRCRKKKENVKYKHRPLFSKI